MRIQIMCDKGIVYVYSWLTLLPLRSYARDCRSATLDAPPCPVVHVSVYRAPWHLHGMSVDS